MPETEVAVSEGTPDLSTPSSMDTQWDRVYKRRAAEDLSKGIRFPFWMDNSPSQPGNSENDTGQVANSPTTKREGGTPPPQSEMEVDEWGMAGEAVDGDRKERMREQVGREADRTETDHLPDVSPPQDTDGMVVEPEEEGAAALIQHHEEIQHGRRRTLPSWQAAPPPLLVDGQVTSLSTPALHATPHASVTRLFIVVVVLLFSFLLYRFVPFPPVSSLRSVAPFPLGLLCRTVSLCCVVFLFSAVCYRRRILLVPLYIHVRPVFA